MSVIVTGADTYNLSSHSRRAPMPVDPLIREHRTGTNTTVTVIPGGSDSGGSTSSSPEDTPSQELPDFFSLPRRDNSKVLLLLVLGFLVLRPKRRGKGF